jgi:hypothetical protein
MYTVDYVEYHSDCLHTTTYILYNYVFFTLSSVNAGKVAYRSGSIFGCWRLFERGSLSMRFVRLETFLFKPKKVTVLRCQLFD